MRIRMSTPVQRLSLAALTTLVMFLLAWAAAYMAWAKYSTVHAAVIDHKAHQFGSVGRYIGQPSFWLALIVPALIGAMYLASHPVTRRVPGMIIGVAVVLLSVVLGVQLWPERFDTGVVLHGLAFVCLVIAGGAAAYGSNYLGRHIK